MFCLGAAIAEMQVSKTQMAMARLDSRLRDEAIRGAARTGCGHASDCAVHNPPAYPAGDCDCGFEPARHCACNPKASNDQS